MKKILSIILAASICFSVLTAFSGCGCEHSDDFLIYASTTATCTQDGVETYDCGSCGAKGVVTKEVEAYGHDYSVNVEEHNNLKCKYCDLLKYNVTLEKVPETITVYQKYRDTWKLDEFTVNGVDWELNSDNDIAVKISVTPTFVGSSSLSAGNCVVIFVDLFDLDENNDLKDNKALLRSGQITFEKEDEGKTKDIWVHQIGGEFKNKQYKNLKAVVYSSYTCGYDQSFNYTCLSYK